MTSPSSDDLSRCQSKAQVSQGDGVPHGRVSTMAPTPLLGLAVGITLDQPDREATLFVTSHFYLDDFVQSSKDPGPCSTRP